MSRAALLSLVLVVGCSSAPEAPELVDRPVRPVVDPSLAPDRGLVASFHLRLEALSTAPVCQAALVRDEADLAHALFVQSEHDALRARIGEAFARPLERHQPTLTYLDSERARRASPELHARGRAALARALATGSTDDAVEAEVAFRQAKDALMVREALRVAAVVTAPAATPVEDTSMEERRALARRHVERRQPLEALRHAATLVREHGERVPAGDRLLLARAHHLAAQTEQSLAEALLAADDAKRERDLRTEAASRALVAELMIDLSRPDAAADEFDAAERLFLQAGDPAGRLRQAVNRAGVLLRVRRADDALGALSPVLGLSLPGEEGADLTCRRDVTAALIELVAGRAGGDETARRVEQALDVARAAGAYRAVEQYSALPGRLRPGPG